MTQHPLLPTIRHIPGITLYKHEFDLLKRVFAAQDEIKIIDEFTAGRSGARVLLASLGHSQAPMVVKIGDAEEIREEFRAYECIFSIKRG